jgi:hypothetical protein
MFTVVSRIAHKTGKRVYRVNINGKYRWFGDVDRAYAHSHHMFKAKRLQRIAKVAR